MTDNKNGGSWNADEAFPAQPLDDRMVVEEVKFEADLKIIMPDSAKSRLGARYGRVLAIGPGKRNLMTGERMENDIELRDVVMHREYSGTPFKHAGRPFLLLEREDCISIINEETYDPTRHLHSSAATSSSALPGLGGSKLIIPKP